MAISSRDVYIGYVAIADDNKRFVILHTDGEDYFYLLINSEKTDFQIRNTKIGRLQMPLEHKGRESYLKWDSFLSCEKIHEGKLRDLQRRVSAGEIKKKGTMSREDFERARAIIFKYGIYDLVTLEVFGIYEEDFEGIEMAAE